MIAMMIMMMVTMTVIVISLAGCPRYGEVVQYLTPKLTSPRNGVQVLPPFMADYTIPTLGAGAW